MIKIELFGFKSYSQQISRNVSEIIKREYPEISSEVFIMSHEDVTVRTSENKETLVIQVAVMTTKIPALIDRLAENLRPIADQKNAILICLSASTNYMICHFDEAKESVSK